MPPQPPVPSLPGGLPPMGGTPVMPTPDSGPSMSIAGGGIGATPNIPGVNVPMTPEHKVELQELLSKIKQEYMKWKSMSFGIHNQAEAVRKQQLQQVFQMLQAKGVNLNNPKSVSEFLNNLKKTAPQNFDAVTKALDYLLGTDYENQNSPTESILPQGPQ